MFWSTLMRDWPHHLGWYHPLPYDVCLIILYIGYFLNAIAVQFFAEPSDLLIVGIVLDVIGAVILAIPDIPSLWRRFYAGRIGYAKQYLKQWPGTKSLYHPKTKEINGFTWRDSCGFHDIIHAIHGYFIHIKQSPMPGNPNINSIDWDNIHRMCIETRKDKTTGEDVEKYVGYEGGWNGKEQFAYRTNWIDQQLENIVARLKSRTRRLGLYILIMGFLQQALATLYGYVNI